MSTPTYSVIIPTLGKSDYLSGIVKTFLSSASSVSVEVVIVFDDPAQDPARNLSADVLADPRVVVLRNDVNLGVTRSLNRAIAAASGDFIVRADDDDLPAPNRIEKIAAYFDSHPEVDLVYSFAQGRNAPPTGEPWLIKGPTEDAAIKEALLHRNFIVHATIALRRKSYAPLGFYDESFRNSQDYDLYLRTIRAGLTFGCIPEPLVTRIYHQDSLTVSGRKRQILNSFAARLLHQAQTPDCSEPAIRVMLRYGVLFLIPNWVRALRRRLNRGR